MEEVKVASLRPWEIRDLEGIERDKRVLEFLKSAARRIELLFELCDKCNAGLFAMEKPKRK